MSEFRCWRSAPPRFESALRHFMSEFRWFGSARRHFMSAFPRFKSATRHFMSEFRWLESARQPWTSACRCRSCRLHERVSFDWTFSGHPSVRNRKEGRVSFLRDHRALRKTCLRFQTGQCPRLPGTASGDEGHQSDQAFSGAMCCRTGPSAHMVHLFRPCGARTSAGRHGLTRFRPAPSGSSHPVPLLLVQPLVHGLAAAGQAPALAEGGEIGQPFRRTAVKVLAQQQGWIGGTVVRVSAIGPAAMKGAGEVFGPLSNSPARPPVLTDLSALHEISSREVAPQPQTLLLTQDAPWPREAWQIGTNTPDQPGSPTRPALHRPDSPDRDKNCMQRLRDLCRHEDRSSRGEEVGERLLRGHFTEIAARTSRARPPDQLTLKSVNTARGHTLAPLPRPPWNAGPTLFRVHRRLSEAAAKISGPDQLPLLQGSWAEFRPLQGASEPCHKV